MLAFHTSFDTTATATASLARPVRLPAGTYRRRQFVAGLLLAVAAFLLVTLAAHSLRGGEGTSFAPRTVAEVQVVVEPGDTVWSIAGTLVGGEDVRPVVDAIVEANGGATLVPGQRLVVTLP